jgi:acetolactate synthase-1/2/3 large subunit
MPTCADVFARTLADLGITRMFGLPGGEILDFLDAARRAGIDFVLTHDESAAAFMADATGQMQGRPGVCVSTLGPGALKMVLGVANAFLDRSPVLAISAALPASMAPYATHQNLDMRAVYAPFTKDTLILDGCDTAAKIRRACRTAVEPRPGPVHIALPSDVARMEDQEIGEAREAAASGPESPAPPSPEALRRFIATLRQVTRPVLILGLDLAPYARPDLVRQFVEHLGVPTFVTPKAKGVLPEDHPLFYGVCAGVAADHVILDFFGKADLLVGVGYDPVESNRIWHETMKLAAVGPMSIAHDRFVPCIELVGDLEASLRALIDARVGPFTWPGEVLAAFRAAFDAALRTSLPPAHGALSPWAVTRRLRALLPRETLATTDVGAVKFIVSQAWTTFEGGTLLQSNGLSSMSFALPAAMAARLLHPNRPVLCTVGDGGLCMSLGELETSVRRGLDILIVVFNDNQLSLIDVIQQNKALPRYGVRYGRIDFARVATAMGAWGRRVASLEELDEAVVDGMHAKRPALIDVPVDAEEYRLHTRPWSA